MVKKRFDLGQTMADAASNIEEAKKDSVLETAVPTIPLVLVPEFMEAKTDVSPVVESEKIVAEEEETPTVIIEKEETQQTAAPTSDKKKKKPKKTAIIDTNRNEKMNVRNVELDDETLWRLDMVKSKMNRSRTNNEPMISQMSIISTALVAYLDKHHPETKEAYKIINNISK